MSAIISQILSTLGGIAVSVLTVWAKAYFGRKYGRPEGGASEE